MGVVIDMYKDLRILYRGVWVPVYLLNKHQLRHLTSGKAKPYVPDYKTK